MENAWLFVLQTEASAKTIALYSRCAVIFVFGKLFDFAPPVMLKQIEMDEAVRQPKNNHNRKNLWTQKFLISYE